MSIHRPYRWVKGRGEAGVMSEGIRNEFASLMGGLGKAVAVGRPRRERLCVSDWVNGSGL